MLGQTISHYKIIEKLGEGGMGVVYKAQDTKLDRLVALKFLPPHLTASDEEKARFLQEAKAASALNHPNVCTIYGIEEYEGQQFIEMEYVEGVTLREKIQGSPLKLSDVLSYGIQIGEALQEAHSKGIVHRDVKAENVMINTKNQVKVMDFGLAKLKGSLKLTRTSSTVGTLAYMSPEQIQGGDVDARSDIFSFGVVLYEMLTSRLPFRGEHEAAMMYSIVNEEPDLPLKYRSDTPAELERIILRTLEKDPDDRFQHADDMVSELRRLKKQTSRVVRPDPVTTVVPTPQATGGGEEAVKPGLPTASKRLLIGISGLIVLLALLAVAYFRFLTPKAAINSMAVLPFVNVGGDPNTEYLSDGFTESLINSLSKLPGIKMMSRSSVFRFKGTEIDPQTVGRDLGVAAVLTGRISQRGDALSISVELVDARDNSHIWGEQYVRKASDIIALQSEISREISNRLKVTLTGEQETELTKHATENTEAYQLYLKGRFYWNKRNQEGFEKAAEYFRQSIEKDPSYALAYAGLADTYELLGSYFIISPKEAWEKTTAAARHALELDPSLGEAHIVIATTTAEYEWDWASSQREYLKGVELSPNYATGHQWYGESLISTGQFDEGIRELRKAQELDPLSPIVYLPMAYAHLVAHNYDEAIREAKKALEIDPNFARAHASLGQTYLSQGKGEEAIIELKQAIESDSSIEYIASLGYVYGKLGQTSSAERILNQMLETSHGQYVSPFLIAVVYAGLNDKNRMFDWLKRSVETHDIAVVGLKVDPTFQEFKHDPRFEAILKEIGLP
jgi:serine/threonine protein kinase/Tfp pilus assembly protein PilF